MAAGGRDNDLMSTASPVAPAVEVLTSLDQVGNQWLDGEAVRIVTNGECPWETPRLAVYENLESVRIRVDQEYRAFAEFSGILESIRIDSGSPSPYGIRRRSELPDDPASLLPPHEAAATSIGHVGIQFDRGGERVESIPRFRTDCDHARFRGVGTGRQVLLQDEIRFEPSRAWISSHRSSAAALVAPAPEDVSLPSKPLRQGGLEHVAATRHPFESGRRHHALPVDNDFQSGRIRRNRGQCRRMSVEPRHTVNVSLGQPCRS